MPTFVQSHLSTADNTVSVAYPTANTAGNLLVVAVRYGANPGTLSDSRGNTYTQILDWNDGGGYTRAWYAPNCAAGANTLTLSNKAAIWILLEYSDVQAATPLDASNTGATSLSVTTTAATDLLVMIGGNVGGSVAPGQTGSYTMRRTHYQSYGGTPQSLTAWDTVAGSAGSYSNTLTNASRGVLAAFKAAVVAGIVISPTSGVQGDAVTVTVTGTATHFSSSSVVTVSGSGVAVVGAPIVASATSLTAVLGISSLATTGARTLTVTTGSEVVTATFTVSALAALTQRGNVDFDQVKAVARHGDGVKFQMFGGGATVAGNVAVFDAGGNVIDGGAGGGGGMTITVDGVPI